MTTFEILDRFITNREEYLDMVESNHNCIDQTTGKIILNSYHAEGSVWTHTLMVLNLLSDKNLLVKIAALLHDVGKPAARFETFDLKRNKMKASFNGHEGISAFMSIDILNDLFPELTDDDKRKIFRLIAEHTDLHLWGGKDTISLPREYGDSEHFYNLLALSAADASGRISDSTVTTAKYEIFEGLAKRYGFAEFVPWDGKQSRMHLMIGPSGSGKSNLAHFIGESCTVFNWDNLMEQMTEGESYIDKFGKCDHIEINDEMERLVTLAMKDGCNVVIDMCNLSKKSRKRWLGLARRFDYYVTGHIVCSGMSRLREIALTRHDNRGIDYQGLLNQLKTFSFPKFNEIQDVKMHWTK